MDEYQQWHELCLDPATGKVSNFYRGDGLQGNEFSDGVAVLDSRSGNMVFGGMNGVTWFNPLRIQQRKHKLPLYLTSFLIGDQTVHAGTKSGSFTITDKSVEESTQFDLSLPGQLVHNRRLVIGLQQS